MPALRQKPSEFARLFIRRRTFPRLRTSKNRHMHRVFSLLVKFSNKNGSPQVGSRLRAMKRTYPDLKGLRILGDGFGFVNMPPIIRVKLILCKRMTSFASYATRT